MHREAVPFETPDTIYICEASPGPAYPFPRALQTAWLHSPLHTISRFPRVIERILFAFRVSGDRKSQFQLGVGYLKGNYCGKRLVTKGRFVLRGHGNCSQLCCRGNSGLQEPSQCPVLSLLGLLLLLLKPGRELYMRHQTQKQ